jgi:hypothetical protein
LFGGQWKVLLLGEQWKENEQHLFYLFPLSPLQILLKPSIFSFDLKVLLYHGSRPLLTHSLLFLWPINYDYASWCNKSSTHSLSIWFWLKISFLFLKIMASRMTTTYRL